MNVNQQVIKTTFYVATTEQSIVLYQDSRDQSTSSPDED